MSIVLSIALLAVGCGPGGPAVSPGAESAPAGPVGAESLGPADLGAGEALQVIATTSLVGDVVGAVGGDGVELTVLLPIGVDPHAYSATPQDLRQVQDAHVVFVNGLGLEGPLLSDLEAAAPGTPVVSLSRGIETRGRTGSAEGGIDPHVWFDPHRVAVWAQNAANALSDLDPNKADTYQERAADYIEELEELDAWIQDQIASVPAADRQLVTDHLVFGYFAERYGFEMVGAVIPAYSSLAEPSAHSLAELEGLIAERQVKAVFVGISANPALSERISQDLGVRLVPLYVESLSEPGGPAASYLEFMRFDVERIVEALS